MSKYARYGYFLIFAAREVCPRIVKFTGELCVYTVGKLFKLIAEGTVFESLQNGLLLIGSINIAQNVFRNGGGKDLIILKYRPYFFS